MNFKDQYIEPDNSYHQPSRDPSSGTMMLVITLTVVSVVLTSVLALIFYSKKNNDGVINSGDGTGATINNYISVSTPTPTPVPPLQDYQNPQLYPASAIVNIDPNAIIADDVNPNARGITQNVINGSSILTSFARENPIHIGDPLYYSQIAGVITYRGNNFRNTASFGFLSPDDGAVDSLVQAWEFNCDHSLLSSDMTFEWVGYQLTGQPLIVRWPATTRTSMNLYPEKAAKADLVEVISASLDGYIYFLDLDDGSMTRDPIYVGATVKGTPALDPRGYPLLYVGQGDDNNEWHFGMYIYSLLDGSLLYTYEGLDDGAYRMNWGAFDSSPIIDGATDTLIWPCENGIIYNFQLNTTYVPGSGTIMISPVCTGYKYIFNDTQGRFLGVESSASVYDHYCYFMDNNSNLVCLDLNTLQMVWVFRTGDDSDLSPVVSEENGIPYIYIATEVDYQGGTGTYNGAAYTYKINGLTGEEVWQTSQSCYTYNGETSATDQSGGCLANPILGRMNISNLVIFSYSMTNGLTSGNRLVAYNRDTGTEVWHYDMNIYTYSSPVACYTDNGNAYIIICDSFGQVHLVDGMTGERITYIQINNATFEASPAVFGNTLVIGTREGKVYGIRIG
ncbi:MAG: pyrrolo-quinoline quinone [Saccharofermentans sp.]|nr:pyrrolo-quinoline quinone [Saccharofermentans sp.]